MMRDTTLYSVYVTAYVSTLGGASRSMLCCMIKVTISTKEAIWNTRSMPTKTKVALLLSLSHSYDLLTTHMYT